MSLQSTTRSQTGRTDIMEADLQTEHNIDVYVPSTATVTYNIESRVVGSERWIAEKTAGDETTVLELANSHSGRATGGRQYCVNILTYSGSGAVEVYMNLAKVYPS